jgi:hypothetical protein
LAEPLSPDDYGWFTPVDLQNVIRAIHRVRDWQQIILVGGQSLTAWVQYFKIELPAFEGPYLTADADFLGSKVEAEVIARYLHGTTKAPAPDDPTPNTAIIEFTGERGEKLLIDMLIGVLGVPTPEARKLAVPVELAGCEPIQVLHPLLVLESRCHNLERLSHKRDGNGITQARVACQVVTRYLAELSGNAGAPQRSARRCRTDSEPGKKQRRRVCLDAMEHRCSGHHRPCGNAGRVSPLLEI